MNDICHHVEIEVYPALAYLAWGGSAWDPNATRPGPTPREKSFTRAFTQPPKLAVTFKMSDKVGFKMRRKGLLVQRTAQPVTGIGSFTGV